jgi:glycosyltransferase involved in cell wall biosynthesis
MIGSNWDKARKENYKSFYQLLDETHYFDVYGPDHSWKEMSLCSYRGELPFDDHSVIDTLKEKGITLVLHSHEWLKDGVPTSRIFEAAAASTVIICDEHPFVKKHFGDSVLYIDPNQNPKKVFDQIDKHVRWVLKNPKAAMALAKRSYAIYKANFTLEKEMLKVGELYEEIKNTKK